MLTQRALLVQKRSEQRLLAAGAAQLGAAELELQWKWNLYMRRRPVNANAEVSLLLRLSCVPALARALT